MQRLFPILFVIMLLGCSGSPKNSITPFVKLDILKGVEPFKVDGNLDPRKDRSFEYPLKESLEDCVNILDKQLTAPNWTRSVGRTSCYYNMVNVPAGYKSIHIVVAAGPFPDAPTRQEREATSWLVIFERR
jgi:hypothetical protein